MEPCERRARDTKGEDVSKAVPRLSTPQRQELEHLYRQCARPSSAILQQFIKDRPLLSQLDIHLLRAWFQSRRLKEKRNEKLSPLINKNAELKAEHETLLILNNQLKNQALLLNLENQLLKEQLEQRKQSASSPVPAQLELEKAGDSSEVDEGEGGTSCESGTCGLDASLVSRIRVQLT